MPPLQSMIEIRINDTTGDHRQPMAMARGGGGGGCVYRCVLAAAAIVCIGLGALLYSQYKNPTPPRYYASIVSVSGVSVDSWQPQIVLTLGVESRSPLWGRPCLKRGTAVAVAYDGVALAFGATGEEVCADPWKLWKVRKTTVVARSSVAEVGALPESVVIGMLTDAHRGDQTFSVTIRIPATRQDGAHGDHDGKLASCVARLVADDDEPDACVMHYA